MKQNIKTQSFKKKIIKIKDLFFNIDLYFVFGFTKEQSYKIACDFFKTKEKTFSRESVLLEIINPDYNAITLSLSGDIVIIFPNFTYTYQCFGTLAHEIFHVAEMCMQITDSPTNTSTSEIMARIISKATTEIHENLWI